MFHEMREYQEFFVRLVSFLELSFALVIRT